jgi:hypothetical protein
VTPVLKRAVICAAVALAAGTFFATPGNADPGENPCELAFNYFCKFLPIAPELEGDLDLTQQQPVDPNAPPPESLPVVDPCAAGCI